MLLVLLSLGASAILLTATYAMAKSRHGLLGVCWLNGMAALTTLFCLPALFLQSLGTFLAAAACRFFNLKPKSALVGSIVATIASYGLLMSIFVAETREQLHLRERFPLESVADRLAYETTRQSAVDANSTESVLAAKVEQRLDLFETAFFHGYRSYALSELHNRTTVQFVMASGFGPIRMARFEAGRVRLLEAPPAPLPLPLGQAQCDPATGEPIARTTSHRIMDQAPPAKSALLGMHDQGLYDFLDRDRMGYIKDRDHVAGFVPHRFSSMPTLFNQWPAGQPWQVVRLELVSLLKHETPVAYVTEYLPQMDQLYDAPTRPLDEFEQGAIDRLRTDEDLVIDDRSGRIRMVGSLRAGKNCLECHQVPRGELLGAFSYELVPERE